MTSSMLPTYISDQLNHIFTSPAGIGNKTEADEIIDFFIEEVGRSQARNQRNDDRLRQAWMQRDFSKFVQNLDLSHLPNLYNDELASLLSPDTAALLNDSPRHKDILQLLTAINAAVVTICKRRPSPVLSSPLSAIGYTRNVLLLYPFPSGVLITIEYVFPHHRATPLHNHPKYIVEEIVSGDLVELHFKARGDGGYQFIGREILTEGSKLQVVAQDRRPHAVHGLNKPCHTIATFVGRRPMQLIDHDRVSNMDRVPPPFSTTAA